VSTHGTIGRREFLRRAGLAAAAGTLVACAPAPAPTLTPPPQEPVKEPVAGEPALAYEQGELHVLICCSGPEEQEAKLQFNQRFADARTGVTVRQEPLPAGQSYFEKLLTVIAAGTAPDVYDMWEGYVQPYAKNGALMNMEPFLEKDGKLKKTDIWEGGLPAVSWEGSLYAMLIAIMPGPISLFYNKDLLDAARVEYPKSDWTWDRMREAAISLTVDKSGEPEQYGLVFENWFVPWTYWIWSNGGDVFADNDTKCALTDSRAYEAVQYWADLVVKDKCAPTPSTLAAMGGARNMFQTGLVAMYVGNCWDLAALNDARKQGLNWGSCLSPTANDGNRTFYQHTWCWGIWTGTKKPNLAWEYVRDFVIDEEMMTGFNTFQKSFPGIKRMLHTFMTPETEELGWTGVVDIVKDPRQIRYPGAGDRWDKISSMIQAEMVDLAFLGEKTAGQGAREVCPKVEEELARA
jgi:multiple sugar transport system substrate-binding protein